MNQTQIKHAELLREAFNEYLVHVHELPLNPGGKLLGYDFDFISGRKWHTFGDAMAQCDLRELTNLINGWNDSLCRWHAWSIVLDGRDERQSWELRSEFIDSLAHECLLVPASIRDTITSVATAAFHQVRLSIDRSYRDYLEGDPITPEETLRPLKRKSVCPRLYRPGRIPPGFWKRCVKQTKSLVQVDDGSYVLKDIPGKLAVSYGYGGTPPLDLETIRAANLGQYEKARSCYVEHRAILDAAVEEIEPVESVA